MPTAIRTSVGVGCTESSDYWLSAHPHLREYIVRAAEPTTPGGSTPACGRSRRGAGTPRPALRRAGRTGVAFEEQADFADQVEVSIVYQTDPGNAWAGRSSTTRASLGAVTLSDTSFEDGLGAWSVSGAPLAAPAT